MRMWHDMLCYDVSDYSQDIYDEWYEMICRDMRMWYEMKWSAMMPIPTTWSYKYNSFILTRGYYLVMFCHMPYVLCLIPHLSCMLHTSFIMPHISWLIYLVFHASSLMFQPCLLFISYLYYIYIIPILYLYHIYSVVILYPHYIYTFIVFMIYAMVLYSADLPNCSGRPSISYSVWRIVPCVYSFSKDSLLQYARLCRGDTNCAIYICQPWPSKPLFFIWNSFLQPTNASATWCLCIDIYQCRLIA